MAGVGGKGKQKARSGSTAAKSGKTANQQPVLVRPTPVQRRYLRRGLEQPGGKLPLFEEDGRPIAPRTVRACIEKGWAEPWFSNPLKPDWLVCRITPAGRTVIHGGEEADPEAKTAPKRP